MTNKTKKIVILTEVELKKTLSRLTSEIIEKVNNLENLLLVGIPTRGIDLAKVLEKELFSKTGIKIRKGIIDPKIKYFQYFHKLAKANYIKYKLLKSSV